MKFEFDEIGFKDEIELMNIQRQIQNKQNLNCNLDTLYNEIEKMKNNEI